MQGPRGGSNYQYIQNQDRFFILLQSSIGFDWDGQQRRKEKVVEESSSGEKEELGSRRRRIVTSLFIFRYW